MNIKSKLKAIYQDLSQGKISSQDALLRIKALKQEGNRSEPLSVDESSNESAGESASESASESTSGSTRESIVRNDCRNRERNEFISVSRAIVRGSAMAITRFEDRKCRTAR